MRGLEFKSSMSLQVKEGKRAWGGGLPYETDGDARRLA